MKRPVIGIGIFAVASALSTGCLLVDDDPPPSVSPRAPPAPASTGTAPNTRGEPPHITSIDIAEFPPVGPAGLVSVACTDDRGLSSLIVNFHKRHVVALSGTSSKFSIPGPELGEGFGTLTFLARDTDGWETKREVKNFLVDLSPPTVEIERETVSSTASGLAGEVAFWVRDAWVLGSLELSFKGKTMRHDFPKAYPSTVGQAWDVSRVGFSAADLPEGSGGAIVIATDAAGNQTTKEVQLRVDGTPPTLGIVSPAPSTTVKGGFTVIVAASDPNATKPVSIEVYVGGSPVATLLGPNAQITIDSATLPKGAVELLAIATDEAGNASAPSRVTVNVE